MAQDRARGVYKAVITVCVESSALRTVSFLLFIGPWGTTSYVEDIFFPPLAEVHVRAVSYDRQFLIILRVVNWRALTSEAVVSGNVGLIHFLDGHPMGSSDWGWDSFYSRL